MGKHLHFESLSQPIGMALGLSILLSFSCEEGLVIRFRKESLDSVTVLGFRPQHCTPTADPLCEPPGCGTLEFVMETNQARFLTPELKLEDLDERLRPGINFKLEDIGFDHMFVFQLVDVANDSCTKNTAVNPPTLTGDCAGHDKTCVTALDCKKGFTCRSFEITDLPKGDYLVERSAAGEKFCASQAAIQPLTSTLRFVGLGSDPQPDNDRTLGLDKDGLTLVVAMDNSGSLNGNVGGMDIDLATDPLGDRIAAMLTFFSVLTDEKRSGIRDTLQVGVYELKGTGQSGVVDVLGETFGNITGNRTFTTNMGLVEQAVNSLTNTPSSHSPIWEGMMVAAATLQENAEVRSNRIHSVLLFADSNSDGSTDNASVDSAITALNLPDAGPATATILHLDSIAPKSLGARLGPLSDFQRLACETGGYYAYESSPTALEPQLRQRLGLSFESKWSLVLEIFASGNQTMNQLPSGWYRVGASMTVSLAGKIETYPMSLQKISARSNESYDTRLLIEVQ